MKRVLLLLLLAVLSFTIVAQDKVSQDKVINSIMVGRVRMVERHHSYPTSFIVFGTTMPDVRIMTDYTNHTLTLEERDKLVSLLESGLSYCEIFEKNRTTVGIQVDVGDIGRFVVKFACTDRYATVTLSIRESGSVSVFDMSPETLRLLIKVLKDTDPSINSLIAQEKLYLK